MSEGIAVVIGATQNLGLYVSRELAREGWSVVGIGRSATEEDTATGVHFESIDLAESDASANLQQLLADVKPSLIVSNAVTYGSWESGDPDLQALEVMFRVNALVPFLALSAHLPSEQNTSCVVVNSDSIFHANRRVGPYAASKAALKILTTALADGCRSTGSAVSTLLLGPLADERKLADCVQIAKRNGVPVKAVVGQLLKRGNPFYMKDDFLQFDECYRSIRYIQDMGAAANGMVCKLDGGASGSLY